jgi:hypothetical protein
MAARGRDQVYQGDSCVACQFDRQVYRIEFGFEKTRCRPVADPQTYGKLTLNVELAGAARLHRAASVLMDGLAK